MSEKFDNPALQKSWIERANKAREGFLRDLGTSQWSQGSSGETPSAPPSPTQRAPEEHRQPQ